MTERNKTTVFRFFELLNSGKTTRASALVAPDVKWWVPESLPYGVLPQFVGVRGGMKISVTSLVAEGDVVVAEVESRGLHLCGQPFTSNKKYLFRIVLRDGLFTEVKEHVDTYQLTAFNTVLQTMEYKAILKG